MRRTIVSTFVASAVAFLVMAVMAWADWPNSIWHSVAACDPTAPANCLQPNSDGSINIGTGAFTGTVSINQGNPGTTNGVVVNGGGVVGNTNDAACSTDTGTCTLQALIKRNNQNLTTATVAPGQTTKASSVPVTVASDQGALGSVTVTSGTVGLAGAATGGCTPNTLASAASTNATSAAGGVPVTVCWLNAVNTTTTLYYLNVYNKASAPTCNSDTIVQTIPVPPAASAGLAGGIVENLGTYGSVFSAGFAFCLTATAAGTGNAATGVYINYGTHS